MKKENKRMIKWIIITSIIMLVFNMVIQNIFGAIPANDYWLIPDMANEGIPRWVPVYYHGEIFDCDIISLGGQDGDLESQEHRGCYVSGPTKDEIHIVKSMMYNWANQGCNVRDHEYYHAMGYKHGVGPLSTTCPNPALVNQNESMNVEYNENNIKHKSPDNPPVIHPTIYPTKSFVFNTAYQESYIEKMYELYTGHLKYPPTIENWWDEFERK